MVAAMGTVAQVGMDNLDKTSLICVESVPPQYYLRLVCYVCKRVYETPLSMHTREVYVHATMDGLG